MASRTDSTKRASTAAGPRFELPALDFKFGSLTEGTNIPPPLPSPIQEEAGPTPPDTPKDGNHKANGSRESAFPKVSTTAGVKRRAEDNPASPTLSSRPGSIRRLFSRSLLNAAYVEGEEGSKTARPPSRGGASVADSRKIKRSSGWLSRFRSSDSKHSGPLSPPLTDDKKPSGPPPPMIPELAVFKTKGDTKGDDGFGSDLFKNIK
ncbi:hypothetical protein QBC35DRAFT_200921 [Podospora australis]|uniref:Uncharacterized protein n=1 Tax=Podospora australis TaxID=1536484 RepID=A0AAN6X5Z0_9PEZI|nr:hypothetical protein QBC35DRAFT_200921 [Podospora australis]